MSVISALVKAGGYGKRILKVTPDFLLGTGADVMGPAAKATKGSIWQKAKGGFRGLEKHVAKQSAKHGNFFKRMLHDAKTLPASVKSSAKAGSRLAKMAGKNKVWGATKGVFKALGKKMPFIGAVLTLAIEAPNIYGAFKDGGFKAGMKELGGVGVELGCMATGAAIGSCFGPVGTLVGGLVGGIVGMFVRGETHSEKKAAQEAEAQLPQYDPEDVKVLKEQFGFTDEEIETLRQNGYTMEDIAAAIEEELKAEEEAAKQETAKREKNDVAPADNTRVEKPKVYEPIQPSNSNTSTTATNPLYSYQMPQYGNYIMGTGNYGGVNYGMNWNLYNPYSFGGFNLGNPYMSYNMGNYSNPFSIYNMGTPSINLYDYYTGNNNYFRYTG